MESTFAQTIQSLLRFRSCCAQMEPPIVQCSWGHQYCSKCLNESGKCSLIHSPEETKRSYFIEKLCFDTLFKCTYSDDGCDISGNCIVISKHEQYCPFSSKLSSLKCKTGYRSVDCGKVLNQHSKPGEESYSRTVENSHLVGQSQLEVFLAEFECPVCLRRIPKMAQCINHHVFCVQCFTRVKKCPVCRGLKSERSNVLLNLILWKVEAPCQYVDDGCDFRGNNFNVNIHGESCGFVPRSCPLIDTCNWQGIESQVLDHCRKIHTEEISSESGRKWTLRDFSSDPNRKTSCSLLFTDGLLLRCIWIKYEDEVMFSVNYLVKNDEKKPRHIFELNIFDRDSESVAAGRINVCSRITDNCIQYLRKNAVRFGSDVLLEYSKEDSSLTYNVKVM